MTGGPIFFSLLAMAIYENYSRARGLNEPDLGGGINDLSVIRPTKMAHLSRPDTP